MRHREWWLAAAALIAVATALMLGYWVGTALTCGADCTFNVSLFEAIGTWAGGVGVATIAAWYTVNRRRADRAEASAREAAKEQARLDAEALRQQTERDAEALRLQAARDAEQGRREAAERDARVRALMCTVRFHPRGDPRNGYRRAHVEFTNRLDEVVFWPQLKTVDGAPLGTTDEQVWPSRKWGKEVQFADLKMNASYPTEESAREAFNRRGSEQLAFEFTVRDFRFCRVGSDVTLIEADRQPRLASEV